ncbi:MAG: phosphotransferase family protein [Pseudomonadales bacterium]
MSRNHLDIPFQALVERIAPAGTLLDHRALTGGVSAQIDSVRYRLPDGSDGQFVVRRHGTAAWKALEADVTTCEFKLLATLHRAGMRVPRPLLLDVSAQLLPSPYLVMEMVPGTTQVPVAQLDSALAQMAQFLLSLHAQEIDSATRQRLPQREDPVAGALQYLPMTPAYEPARVAIRNWRTSPGAAELLHGDFWPGNILWHEGRLAAVIDWEDAAIGSALSDLAACRAELMVAYGAQAMESFTRHYLDGCTRDTADLVLWEVYVSSAALATMADWGLPAALETARRQATETFLQGAISRLC